MTRAPELWEIIRQVLRRDRWTTLGELYSYVEGRAHLDREDHVPEAPGSSVPKWKRNVRNVLQRRRATDEVVWNGAAEYRRG
jgi:hypothetical protein